MNTKLFRNLNLAGVFVLAVLCVFQWRNESCLRGELGEERKNSGKLSADIAAREKDLQAALEDTAFFKDKFSSAKEELETVREMLRAAETANAKLAADRDVLLKNEVILRNAVKERDAVLEEAKKRLTEFAAGTKDLTDKFNDLAKKYNGVVGALNETRRQLLESREAENETRRQLYKALGKPLPPETSPKTAGK